MLVAILRILGTLLDLKLQLQNLKDKKLKYSVFRMWDAYGPYGCDHNPVTGCDGCDYEAQIATKRVLWGGDLTPCSLVHKKIFYTLYFISVAICVRKKCEMFCECIFLRYIISAMLRIRIYLQPFNCTRSSLYAAICYYS